MNQEWIKEQIDALGLQQSILLEEIPNIDLYMDQLITLFEDKLNRTKRYEQDKLLTKTMINNYTKDKVLMPAVKKKYTKQHIILMLMLYQLKNTMSITDIKELFNTVKQGGEVEQEKLNKIYQSYLEIKQKQLVQFKEATKKQLEMIQEYSDTDATAETFLMVMALSEQATYYKKLAEKIIDEKIKSDIDSL